MDREEPPIITASRLIEDLKILGIGRGQVVMLHASVKAVGWVVGGPDVILRALRDTESPESMTLLVVFRRSRMGGISDFLRTERVRISEI